MGYSFTGGTDNVLAPVTKMYTEMLDEVYAQSSKTTMWSPDPALVRGFQNSKTGEIATLSTSGLGDYSCEGPNQGYPMGNVSLTFTPYVLEHDRAVSFPLHNVDLMQSGNVAVGSATLAEFSRIQLVPEVDACRISRVAEACLTDKASRVKDYTPTKTNILATLKTGLKAIEDSTGIGSGINILFNAKYSDILRNSDEFTRVVDITGSSGKLNSAVGSIDGNPVIMCPSNRMFSSVKTRPGTTPADSGFVPSPDAQEVVALLTAPYTAQGIVAHQVAKIYTDVPDIDGSLVNFHVYHDCIVPKNKIPGCYAILKPSSKARSKHKGG